MRDAWKPVRSLLRSIHERPLLYYGLLVPLSIALYDQHGRLAVGIPPIVPITGLFLLLGIAQGGADRIRLTWQASPGAFWLYGLVCAAELLLGFYHASPSGWLFVAGRVTFLVVLVTVVANFGSRTDAEDALTGLTIGASIIGLLTLVQASRVVQLPFAAPVWPGRYFGSFQLPFPRTLGIDMSRDKYGIAAAVALPTLIASSRAPRRLLGSRWLRIVLFSLVTIGTAITQSRGAYLTVLLALGLTLTLVLGTKVFNRSLFRDRGALLIALGYAALLVVANVAFTAVAPEWFVGVETSIDHQNVYVRSDVNAQGWLQFQEAPLLGVGHGARFASGRANAAIHNHFLEQMVSTGLVGGVPYLLFHLWILVSALQLLGGWRQSQLVVPISLLVSVAATYLAYQFFPGFFTSVFAVVCGLVLAVVRQERRLPEATGNASGTPSTG